MKINVKDPLFLGHLLTEPVKLTDSQALIFEVMDECRPLGDLMENFGFIKKQDLVFAFVAYEARINFKADPFVVFLELCQKQPATPEELDDIYYSFELKDSEP